MRTAPREYTRLNCADVGLKPQDFFIGIQTEEQAHQMSAHQTKFVAIDSTHKITDYEGSLFALAFSRLYSSSCRPIRIRSNLSDVGASLIANPCPSLELPARAVSLTHTVSDSPFSRPLSRSRSLCLTRSLAPPPPNSLPPSVTLSLYL